MTPPKRIHRLKKVCKKMLSIICHQGCLVKSIKPLSDFAFHCCDNTTAKSKSQRRGFISSNKLQFITEQNSRQELEAKQKSNAAYCLSLSHLPRHPLFTAYDPHLKVSPSTVFRYPECMRSLINNFLIHLAQRLFQ